MKRDLSVLANQRFDLAVIGGGATGAFIAWEAATRDLRVALIERGDFSEATSAANSRLIHGGLRYLAQGHLKLVREAARERAYWLAAAPHLVRPLPFLLPVRGALDRARLALGLKLYDRLGRSGDAPLPAPCFLSAAAAASRAPRLEPQLRRGAWHYHDAQMHAPERLVLAALEGVSAHGGAVANYAAATGLVQTGPRVTGVRVLDRESGDRFVIEAQTVVNATGPWADEPWSNEPGVHDPRVDSRGAVGARAPRRRTGSGDERIVRLTRSAGIHLVLPPLLEHTAVLLRKPRGHLFLLPWRGHTLLGTTDERFDGDPDQYRVTSGDIDRLLEDCARLLPALDLDASQLRYAYGGLRPLVEQAGGTYRASRRAAIVDHASEGRKGLITVLGGKWTTSRALAERVLDRLLPARPSTTLDRPLAGAPEAPAGDWLSGLQAHHPALPRSTVTHLAGLYGARTETLLAAIGDGDALEAAEPLYRAQAVHAVTEEMCLTLSDFVFRRTQIGLLGRPPKSTLEALSTAIGDVLGWDQARRRAELATVEEHYRW